MMNQATHDLERRCPRLGGPVKFDYCMDSGDAGLPCAMICDCWWEDIDVVEYLKNVLSAEDFETLMNRRPTPKISGLLQLIEQAQKRSRTDD
jgi:hypothetical protein